MNARELALRKELAVTHLKIARGELALARAQKPSTAMTATSSAIDLATSLLDQPAIARFGGRWGSYLRIALRVARIVVAFARPTRQLTP